jgi:centriolar protein POC1
MAEVKNLKNKPESRLRPAKSKLTVKVQPRANQADPSLMRSFKGHKEGVMSTTFIPHLKQSISGSMDGTVMVWNFKPNMRPFRFVGHKGPVYSVASTPNGDTIVSGSADETIRIWKNSIEGFS